jgi:hypothetical protein
MTVSVKKLGLNIPETITRKAGIKPGDVVQLTVRQGTITIHAAAQVNESRYPLYTPTKAEARAIARGLAEYQRGEYVTLKQLNEELDARRHKVSKQVTRKAP